MREDPKKKKNFPNVRLPPRTQRSPPIPPPPVPVDHRRPDAPPPPPEAWEDPELEEAQENERAGQMYDVQRMVQEALCDPCHLK